MMAAEKKRIGDTDITKAGLAKLGHLAGVLMPASLLNARDKQNVPAVLRLYKWVHKTADLGLMKEELTPSERRALEDLSSLGLLFNAVLGYYYDNTNDLTTRLKFASIVAHTCLVLYRHNGAKFMSSRLYVDSVEEVMAQFVDVLRQEREFPGTKHYVCLRGNQQMETHIGCLRQTSHDTRYARFCNAALIALATIRLPLWIFVSRFSP